MADNDEHTGHNEPQAGSAPEGDFPADFFDDVNEPPSSLPRTPPGPTAENPLAPAPPPRPPAGEPPAPAGGPSTLNPPHHVTREDDVRRKTTGAFPILMGVAMVGVLAAAWFINKQQGAGPPVASTPEPAAVPASSPAAPAVADTEALESKLKELAATVDELTARTKAVEGKVNDLPKPEPAPDLKPIEGKVADLAKSAAAVDALKDQVAKLDERFGSVDDGLKSVKEEVAALKDDLRKAAAPSQPAADSKPAATDDATAALSGGAELFKAGKYKEADEVFKKLAAGNPKDARVYYYAALTRGLTTNEWQGKETLATAAKGAELEKAGSPKAPEIDAAFADLRPDLKGWVNFFRKRAK